MKTPAALLAPVLLAALSLCAAAQKMALKGLAIKVGAHGEIPDIKPVMQMQIKFTLKSADGAELRSEVINTIHALAAE